MHPLPRRRAEIVPPYPAFISQQEYHVGELRIIRRFLRGKSAPHTRSTAFVTPSTTGSSDSPRYSA
jgi:hypothetical protein